MVEDEAPDGKVVALIADIAAREYLSLREEILETFRRTSRLALLAFGIGGAVLSVRAASSGLADRDFAVVLSLASALIAAMALVYIGQSFGVIQVHLYCVEQGREVRRLVGTLAGGQPQTKYLLGWEERMELMRTGDLRGPQVLQGATLLEPVAVAALSAGLAAWSYAIYQGPSLLPQHAITQALLVVNVGLLVVILVWGAASVRHLRSVRAEPSDEAGVARSAAGRTTLTDGDLFLTALGIADLNPLVDEAIRESVGCFRHGLYTPSRAMLARAAEGLWMGLGAALVKVPPGNDGSVARIRKAIDSGRMHFANLVDDVAGLYARKDLFDAIAKASGVTPDDIRMAQVWTEQVRDSRNVLHHGVEAALPNDYEMVAALLLGAAPTFRALAGASRAAHAASVLAAEP